MGIFVMVPRKSINLTAMLIDFGVRINNYYLKIAEHTLIKNIWK
jgi:hypothetical protein